MELKTLDILRLHSSLERTKNRNGNGNKRKKKEEKERKRKKKKEKERKRKKRKRKRKKKKNVIELLSKRQWQIKMRKTKVAHLIWF